jgi:O-methyltransferase involved in polyketide biosynthesis
MLVYSNNYGVLMSDLTAVSKTLYVPLLGRIYASKNHPDILYDKMALSIADEILKNNEQMKGESEYTLLSSAVRSKNIDHYIQTYLLRNPNGIIVNIGCGLETIYYRNDNNKALWFELDLPDVLNLRSKYFPEELRDRYLCYSMFDYKWIDIVRKTSKKPVMVIASGLFYYFHEDQVIDFIKHLTGFEYAELVFDAVSSVGIKGSKHYMKKMKKQDAEMFFSVDNAKTFIAKISPDIGLIEEQKYFSLTKFNTKMAFATKFKMNISDMFNMVKMIHLKVN